MKFKQFVLIAVLAVGLSACETNTPEQGRGRYSAMFDQVWDLLDKNYVFLSMVSCDMDSLQADCKHKISEISDPQGLQTTLTEMLEAIGDPNIGIVYDHTQSYKKSASADNSIGLIPYKQDAYEILDSTYRYGDYNFGKAIRTNVNGCDTSFYAIVTFRTEINSSTSYANSLFTKNVSISQSQSKNKGLILDMRGCRWADSDFANTILQCFYPLGEEYNFTAQIRSPLSLMSTAFVNYPERDIHGEGLGLYSDRPVAVIINTTVSLTTHLAASALADLPNVAVIGRTGTGGHGGSLGFQQLGGEQYNYIILPTVRYTGYGYESFYAPLLPDIKVDWTPDYTQYPPAYSEDKCLSAAMDYIDEHHTFNIY